MAYSISVAVGESETIRFGAASRWTGPFAAVTVTGKDAVADGATLAEAARNGVLPDPHPASRAIRVTRAVNGRTSASARTARRGRVGEEGGADIAAPGMSGRAARGSLARRTTLTSRVED